MTKTAEANIAAKFHSTAKDTYGIGDSEVSNALNLNKRFSFESVDVVLHSSHVLSASASATVDLLTDDDAFEDNADFDYVNSLLIVNDPGNNLSAGSMLDLNFAASGGWVGSAMGIGYAGASELTLHVYPGGWLMVAIPYDNDGAVASGANQFTLVSKGDGSGNLTAKVALVGKAN